MKLDHSKINELDNMLLTIKHCEESRVARQRDFILEKIVDILNLDKKRNYAIVLFDKNLPASNKSFISSCLVRLVGYSYKSIWEWEYRVNAFELMKSYSIELFRNFKIDKNDDNHLILEKIRDIENNVINQFEQIKQKIINPKSAKNIRTELTKAYRNNWWFISFYINEIPVSDLRMKETFDAIEQYCNSTESDLLGNYQNVNDILKTILNESRESNTTINQKCVNDIYETIKQVVDNDFGRSDLLKPAKLKLSYYDRKYPFHEKNRKINVKFNLNNKSQGYAYDVKVNIDCDDILILNNDIVYGSVKPNQNILITVEGTTINPIVDKIPSLLVRAEWYNFDKSFGSTEEIFELRPQRADLDWETLKNLQPYSLEAVEIEDDLIGRTEIIQKIKNKLSAVKIESLIIHGQKRVGKTSIANIIRNKLNFNDDYIVVSLNVGDLNKNTSEKFVNDLGNFIFEEVKTNKRIKYQLHKPKFEGSISPLLQLFREINRTDCNIRIVIIIDEFDEIPSELYKFSNIGETFFHNIRSLSKENFVGFVLVGSENIEMIKQSTEMINKFENFRVDYFSKEKYWNDFQDLVRKPLKDQIEFEDIALIRLFTITEGNPFYTNLICGNIYNKIVENRNAFITEDDIMYGIAEAINSIETNEVNHFWKDSIIFAESAKRDQIETQRRKFLVGFAFIEREKGLVTKMSLINEHTFKNVIPIKEILDNFINRGIIIEEQERLRIRPKFISEWLKEKGVNKITTSFMDEEAAMILQKKEQSAYVRDEEIVSLSNKWGIYNGQKISPIEIKAWLDQFDDNIERRLMFQILKNLKFYSELEVREKLRIIHEHLIKSIKTLKIGKELSQREILLTSLSNMGKSGSVYLRKYAQENKIIASNIIQFDKLKDAIQNNTRINTLLIIDDIIGTGKTQIDEIKIKLDEETIKLLRDNGIKLVFSSICATQYGIDKLTMNFKEYKLDFEVYCVDVIDESQKCFSETSKFFEVTEDKESARKIALRVGNKIDKKQPLGFEGSELAIVFFDNCPNNSLPIIWKKVEKEPTWFPLFERKHIFK